MIKELRQLSIAFMFTDSKDVKKTLRPSECLRASTYLR
jgi:hypothetical protein